VLSKAEQQKRNIRLILLPLGVHQLNLIWLKPLKFHVFRQPQASALLGYLNDIASCCVLSSLALIGLTRFVCGGLPVMTSDGIGILKLPINSTHDKNELGW
jgi:hypothetical protein